MRLYVGGLPYQTNEQDLIELFEQVGPVTFSTVITDRETGRSKGFGFVELSDDDANTAITRLNGTSLGNRTITVNQAQERAPRENRGGGGGGGYDRRGGGGGGGYGGGRDRY